MVWCGMKMMLGTISKEARYSAMSSGIFSSTSHLVVNIPITCKNKILNLSNHPHCCPACDNAVTSKSGVKKHMLDNLLTGRAVGWVK